MGKKAGRTYSIPFQVATAVFILLFLPLMALLSTPASWYSADEYEDLGVIQFVAVKSQKRGKSGFNYYVFYEALDSRKFGFWERTSSSFSAHKAVENQEHTLRHVYRALERPNFILALTRKNAGYQFLREDQEPQTRQELQNTLDRAEKTAVLGRNIALCYEAGYLAVLLIMRRKQKRGNHK